MAYNIDFLIAALVFMLVVLYHFTQQQGFYIQGNLSFIWLVVLGSLCICMDLICAALITWGGTAYRGIAEFCIVVLYCLQILVPSALVNHIFRQIPREISKRRSNLIFTYVLPNIMLLLVLSNHWTRLLFYICSKGVYHRGPLFSLLYFFGAGYLLIAALTCLVHKKYISRFKRYAVWEITIIAGVTLILQAVYRSVLLTGFGIMLSITVLFFTLNNPYHYTDSLTSVFDVRYFQDRVSSYLSHRWSFHLLIVNLPQLKQINRATGAGVGNDILRVTAQMLMQINKQNLVFRITGKRFVVMTGNLVNYEQARSRILDFFDRPMEVDNRKIPVPAVVCGIIDAQKLDTFDNVMAYSEYLLSLISDPLKKTYLIQNSDETLRGYRYNQEVDRFLSTAVEQDLFELYYQPVYSVTEKKFVSMEALSRLQHPHMGPISPDVFIRLAEKNELISQIGLIQLRRACSFLKDNPMVLKTLSSMKFNLSPAELMKPGHVDLLIQTIQDAGLPTEFFQFEMTETVATEYCSSLSVIAEKFSQVGIRLCLDDFGSGYANLSTVFRLPFSTIKLDRSLLSDICENQKAASLYKGLVSAINSMGADIVAEGVETQEELQKVTQCGVSLIQGFYYARPIPSDELLVLLKKQNAEAK